MWLVYGSHDSGKVPFEDAVLAYLHEHDGEALTVADASRALGVGAAAVALALASLAEKGIVEPQE